MKLTLNECINRINLALNYPSIDYSDVYHFFDHAIAELNTSLRIAIPPVSEIEAESRFDIRKLTNLVTITSKLEQNGFSSESNNIFSSKDELPTGADRTITAAYVCGSTFKNRKFYKWNGVAWDAYDSLYGILKEDGEIRIYTTVAQTTDTALWAPVDTSATANVILTDYLPMDWWTLFVIPYVCFKFNVRDESDASVFSDEFAQGFQQLQNSYSVPNTVLLSTVADKPAYKKLVEEHISNLNVRVPTRAIFDEMRSNNTTLPIYGGFYETGGWGL